MPRKPSTIGSFYIVRQPYPKKRWKESNKPEHAPNWIARVRVPGGKQKSLSAMHPICEKCMEAKSPLEERPDCRCQKPAREFAERWLKKEVQLWHAGRLERLDDISLRRGRHEVPLAKVFEVYKANGPSDAAKVVRNATTLLEQATLRKIEDLTTKVLEKRPGDLVVKWAAMRQAYAARGWSVREGTAPANAWQQLHRDWEDGVIPKVPDRHQVRAVNTTIGGYVRGLKTIFSNISRTNYLPGITVPPLPDLMTVELALPKVKGFRRIPAEQYRAMWEAAQVLHDDDLQAWVALQLAWRTGLRTKELRSLKPNWLEKREGFANKAQNGTFLVLKNRPEEGFYLKAKFRGLVRDLRITQDLVDAIEKVKSAESLLGAISDTEAADLLRRVSAWIRQFIPEGPHTLYWFRHLAGALRYTSGSTKAAGALLGHAPGSPVTGDTYIDLVEPVDALGHDELHPDAMGF